MKPVVLILLISACATPETPVPVVPESATAALEAAHLAYVAGDAAALSTAVIHTLADKPEPLVESNALELLEAAYDQHQGRLPAAWSLPDGVQALRLAHIRTQGPTELGFRLVLSGMVNSDRHIAELTLSFGGQKVLDKQSELGEWGRTEEPENGGAHFEVEGPVSAEPAAEGLYVIRIVMADGAQVEGSVVVSGLTSTRSPRPGLNAGVSSANPELVLEDFRSPESRAWEQRTLGIWVAQRESAGENHWKMVWNQWSDRPAAGPVTIGQDGAKISLRPGKHWVGITYGEQRHFGPVTLIRASRTGHPFTVKP